MKTMILAVVSAVSLGTGAAYAAGVPAGSWQEPQYGAQAFSAHQNETQTEFLGRNTVLGKMFRQNADNNHTAAVTTPARGG
jgi:opacity protein-like surface antigen